MMTLQRLTEEQQKEADKVLRNLLEPSIRKCFEQFLKENKQEGKAND